MKETIEQWNERARLRRIQQDQDGKFEKQTRGTYWDEMGSLSALRKTGKLPDCGDGDKLSWQHTRRDGGRGRVRSIVVLQNPVKCENVQSIQSLAA